MTLSIRAAAGAAAMTAAAVVLAACGASPAPSTAPPSSGPVDASSPAGSDGTGPTGAATRTPAPTQKPQPTPTTTGAPAPTPVATESSPPGDIPDNQVYLPYTPPKAGFTVKIPEGWARSVTGGVVTFTDKLNSIRIESTRSATAPTPASVRTAELPAVAATAANYTPGKVSTVSRDSGPAVLATYAQDSTADPVTNKVIRQAVERYELWRGGTTAVLTLSGPTGADNVDPWRIVTDSLRWR